MSLARCNECKETMSHVEFDNHACPFSPKDGVRDGETFAAYIERADYFAAFVHKVVKAQRVSPAVASDIVTDFLACHPE